MRLYFDKQLELLNNEMLNMSDMCEDAISQAISALLNGDRMKAAGLKKSVDQINQQEQRDLELRFRGSDNQRLINMKKTREQGEIVLWGSKK